MYSQGLFESERRLGQPRTEEERLERHIERYGSAELPPRGTGLARGRGLTAYPLTSDEAYAQAKAQLCALSPAWCNATKDQLWQHICKDDCTIFVGSDPIRLAICGTSTCPAPGTGPSEGIGTTLIIGLAGLAVVGVVALAIASSGTKKKVLVAKVRE